MAELFICGDIVNYENQDGIICSQSLADIISKADYSVCNFEAPVESLGLPAKKSGGHHFQRKSTIKGLKDKGFNLLCLANNHIMDYGKEGLIDTLKEARNRGLDTLGAGVNFNKAYRPIIKNINDLKIGFINACEAQFGVIDFFTNTEEPGYAWINHSEIDNQIIKLKKECDFVILLSHAGLEHYDIPQKEWKFRYKHFCDLGVDIVVGSHPHVPQGFEYYKDSIIFYSLGNFYFDSKKYIHKEDKSYSILLNLEKNNKVKFKPIFHYKQEGKVQLSPEGKRIDLEALSLKLDKAYEELHNKMSLDAYNKNIKRNIIYSMTPTPYDGYIKSSFIKTIKVLLGRGNRVDKRLLSLHLLRNEAYYYTAKHALELISKEKNERW